MAWDELTPSERKGYWADLAGVIVGLLFALALALYFAPTAKAQELGAATLSWEPPTQNTDATPLTDLAGFKIYYGNTSGAYNTTINVANPNTTTYVVENLPPGQYFFAATAYNTNGVESDFSGEATKSVTGTPPPPTGPLIVSDDTVYTVVKQTDQFVLIPVGTIAIGTECDESQSVNGHYAVPSDQMTPFGSVVPLVVVARCER